ncbi:MAG TPA: hypothetical protein VFB72_07185 [Verrucomicrobiae bacterium]|nr:hypothetical protein [Verrucomicrobiae bacterium]
MKYTKGIRIIFGLFIIAIAAASQAMAGDVLPILKAGSQTFTNVEVLSVSDTQLFFQSAGVMSSVKLKDLDPELQKTLGYDPAKAESENARVQAFEYSGQEQAQGRTNSARVGMTFNMFRLTNGKYLRLCLPQVWTSSITQPPDAPDYLLIRMEHPFEKDFSVLIEVMPKQDPLAHLETQDATSIPGYHELKNSVEKDLVVYSLEGPETKGNYYALTRKSPGKGPACKSEGMAKVGGLSIGFIIQSNDWKGKEPQAALEMIRTAQIVEKR